MPVSSAPRLDAVVAHVLAWHNRHPLARRIKVAEVGSIGLVNMPFVAPLDGPGMPVAAFTEDFLGPLKPAAVGRWAARHGHAGATAAPGVPLRQVAAIDDRANLAVLVATAAIEVGSQQRRVLVGRGDPAAVLGRRIWSRPRVGAAGALALVLMSLPLWLSWPPGDAGPARARAQARPLAVSVVQPASGARPAPAPSAAAIATPSLHASVSIAPASASASASSPQGVMATAASGSASAAAAHAIAASQPLHVGPSVVAPVAASSPAAVTANAASNEPPPTPAPRPAPKPRSHPSLVGGPTRPTVRPLLDDDSKAEAREAVAEARRALGMPALPAAVSHPASGAVAAVHAPVASGAALQSDAQPRAIRADTGPAFALSTRLLRTRAEAEQVMAAAQALLLTIRAKGAVPLQVEIVPVGDDWRVAAFPFERQPDAERARALLASRGMRVSVIDF